VSPLIDQALQLEERGMYVQEECISYKEPCLVAVSLPALYFF
jgi:hypothetical protein